VSGRCEEIVKVELPERFDRDFIASGHGLKWRENKNRRFMKGGSEANDDLLEIGSPDSRLADESPRDRL
jgi:hypothetical protein